MRGDRPSLWRYPRFVFLLSVGLITLIALIAAIWVSPDMNFPEKTAMTGFFTLLSTVVYYLFSSD